MTLLALTSPYTDIQGTSTDVPDTRAPSTPFATVQDAAKQNWASDAVNSFIGGLATSLGYEKTKPTSDATTANANANPSLLGIQLQPLIVVGGAALLAILVYRLAKGR